MGKRELVLIAVFLVVGIVVYQVTAPPAPEGSDLSVGGIFQRMRRGVQGPRETATNDFTQTYPVAAAIQKLRLALSRPSDLTIEGTDRDDISVEMKVVARGYTPSDAKAVAEAARIAVDPSGGDTMTLTNSWNDRRNGQQAFVTQVTITLVIPKRLQVSLQPHIGLLTVKSVASLDVTSSRGETHVLGVVGDVRLTQSNGTLEVNGAGSLKLSTRGSPGEIGHVGGVTSVDGTGSRLTLAAITGPLEIEARNTDVSIENVGAMKPPLRYNGTGGELRIDGLRAEARIDGRNTDVTVGLAAAAPVTIYNVGAITVTAPPDGYTLDAIATEGRITSEDENITATPENGSDARAAAKVRGGGPALTLRATRGRIDVRSAVK